MFKELQRYPLIRIVSTNFSSDIITFLLIGIIDWYVILIKMLSLKDG